MSYTADGDASTGTRSTSRAFNKRDVPLSDWEIHESEVEICKREDGSLWHLGGGSFGQVFKAIRNGVQPVAGAAQHTVCPSPCSAGACGRRYDPNQFRLRVIEWCVAP